MQQNQSIMITGTHGFVGARVLQAYPTATVVAGDLCRMPGEALIAFVKTHTPDIIINAAAISDIGTCEKNPDASYLANVTLPVTLARAARDIGAKLISFSSDQVYTGCTEEGPYREDMPLPAPANLYARHKLEAEARVLDLLPNAIQLRATWMYDMPLYHHANRGNFLVNTLRAVNAGTPLRAPVSEYRGITYVRQVVSLLDRMMTLPGGVYNYGSENPLSMYETTVALLRTLGLTAEVEAIPTDPARKRHNLWMDTEKLRSHGVCFDTTEAGFARCAADYGMR